MTKTVNKQASYQDIIDLPENMVGEIIHGRLEMRPKSATRYALASSSLSAELVSSFQQGQDGAGGWWIIDEPVCHLDSHVLVPDLVGWRRQRMPALPKTACFKTPPDWICEILSPTTTRIDRIVKMPIYAELGINYLWLIDPVLRTLEAYELHDGHWLLTGAHADNESIAIAPFAEHTFSLTDLWE